MHLAADASAPLQPQPGRREAARYVEQTALDEPTRTGVLSRNRAAGTKAGTKDRVPANPPNLS